MHHQYHLSVLLSTVVSAAACSTPENYGPKLVAGAAANGKVFYPYGRRTDYIPRPAVGNVPYGVIINKCTVPGTVALTFDDGPSEFTNMVLDVLRQFDAKATFFINGMNNALGSIDNPTTPWPALLHRMHAQDQEIVYNEMALRNVLGGIPTYLRPPYGSCTHESGCVDDLKGRGYHIINYDVDTIDYDHDTPNSIQWSKDHFADILTHSGYNQPGSQAGHITLAHDIKYQTAVNLTGFMLSTLRSLGYRTATVGECLNDPKENWYRRG